MDYSMYQDPNQMWYPYGDMYGYPYQEQPQEEDTESQKLRKEQELIEAIESNRLYLRKVRKRCVKEDFADLEKTQLFLFEFLIENMEINTKSDLGLISESDESSEIVARVHFLDNPWLEIREKGEKLEVRDSVLGQTEYFQTVGNAGLNNAIDTQRTANTKGGSIKLSSEEAEVQIGDELSSKYDTKWDNSSGKSLLFSKSALGIIQGLDYSPVKVQVSRYIESAEEDVKGTSEPLGYALVRLPEHFSLSVLQSCKSGVILPVSCVYRDSCDLTNVFGVKKGELQVFVRLSCFGSVITTSFQSVGPDRQYVFKPSPLPNLDGSDESEFKRDTVLKPIVAEEEVAIGISIVKPEDIFQKTVLWKNNALNCECLDPCPEVVQVETTSLQMPHSSDTTLCRDPKQSNREGNPFCEWHKLVSHEIKNNPGGNCGCIDDVKFIKGPSCCKEFIFHDDLPPKGKPSRIEKLGMKINDKGKNKFSKVSEKKIDPIVGLGIRPEPQNCNCDCSQIRNSMAMKPMMKPSWQIK